MESLDGFYGLTMAGILAPNEFNAPQTTSTIEVRAGKGDITSVVACRQCRSRKVRCDSARPFCKNCVRRSDTCEYDVAPKRRGPDRKPRTSQKPYQKVCEDDAVLRRRTASREPTAGSCTPKGNKRQHGRYHVARREQTCTLPLVTERENSSSSSSNTSSPNFGLQFLDDRMLEVLLSTGDIPRGPSCSFYKQTWWSNLLSLYSDNASQAPLKIYQDLSFLLNDTLYWLSFINFRRFVNNLFDPSARAFMQPSVVLAALALSILMKSSELGFGARGRELALLLRDAAQASLDASISASWIDPSLAQAAFLLALFEAIPHPMHAAARTSSSIFLLDSLIQALSLTRLDLHEPTVTTFLVDDIPRVVSQFGSDTPPSEVRNPSSTSNCTCGEVAALSAAGFEPPSKAMAYSKTSLDHILDNINYKVSSEDRFLLEGVSDFRPEWPDSADVVETEKEESRRLCWSSMMLITTLIEYTTLRYELSTWDFHVTKPENFAILFPGEIHHQTNPKDTIWALHCRAALLWNSCQKFSLKPSWEHRRIELAEKAWMEARVIEDAIRKHACPGGHEDGRKYLLQLKLLISEQLTPIFHSFRIKVENERLAHRAGIVHYVQIIGSIMAEFGPAVVSSALSKRPLSIWWAMDQIKSGILLWRSNPDLILALEQSANLLASFDLVLLVWPSEVQRRYYTQIRNELLECCMATGVFVPAAVSMPGFSIDVNMPCIPSIYFIKEASPTDILIAPLD